MKNQYIEDVSNKLGLKSLQSGRFYNNVSFILKLLNGTMDCHMLLKSVNLRTPNIVTRSSQPFVVPPNKNNYTSNNHLCHLLSSINKVIDFDSFFRHFTNIKNVCQ